MGRRRNRHAFTPYETDIQAAVLEHWRLLGLPDTLVAAIPNQNAHGQPGLTPGLADLIVAGPDLPGHPTGFIELKRDITSRRSPEQWRFAELCAQLGIPYAVTFGRDQPIDVLEAWGVVRASNRGVERAREAAPPGGAAGVAEEARRRGV